MTAPSELFLHYPTVAALRADHASNLRRGRAFVEGATELRELALCDLVLVHPETGAALRLPAEVVYVQPSGVGLSLTALEPAAVERLRAFVEDAVAELEVVEEPAAELEVVEEPAAELEVVDEPAAELEVVDEPAAEVELEDGPDTDDADEPTRATGDAATHLHERIRKLTQSEQQRMARNGNLTERTMLERVYGPAVWDALLQNSRLTQPEVARIAKKGTLPKPLVELIAANAAWLGSPEVQRALLSNPRSSPGVVSRVLRALSRSDLARVPQQTAYPMATRLAAKKMIKDP